MTSKQGVPRAKGQRYVGASFVEDLGRQVLCLLITSMCHFANRKQRHRNQQGMRPIVPITGVMGRTMMLASPGAGSLSFRIR